MIRTDVMIIGAGAAGMRLALKLADTQTVILVAKQALTEGATRYAQGGVSVVMDEHDSCASHVQDTLQAGAGLCDEAVVRSMVEQARSSIQWLIDQGVPFTRQRDEDGGERYHLTREGGHSHRRVIHAADATGRAIADTLEARVRSHKGIRVLEHHLAVDLITRTYGTTRCCHGAYLYNRQTHAVRTVAARSVVLATGGAGKVYLYTSNPDVASGDGIAMAWRAGCRVANMEFFQFHPTCLYHPKAKSFLISEAVRGEGGRLLLPDGTAFMSRFDQRAELAPRDVVARAIDHEMKRLGLDHVLLDISHKSDTFIEQHFPTIHRRCQALGFDMRHEPLPVVPAAHYLCGGVLCDMQGQTDIKGLLVIGESACSGLHGANRMASNSLLECLVMAENAADLLCREVPAYDMPEQLPSWDESQVSDADEEVVVSHNWDELRRFMWDYVGIVRSNKRLQRAKHRVRLLREEIHEFYANFRITPNLLELRNLAQVAELIIDSAMQRHESRGLHHTLDYPETDPDQAHATVLTPPTEHTQ